ncbi:MAG: EscU/YscU/HrcU family type III secretion system export apparatus switch protein [Planctomycetota bacterium]
MSDFNNDAQHPASQQRLQQAYSEGKFARSQDLSVSIQMFCVTGILYFSGKSLLFQFVEGCEGYFHEIAYSRSMNLIQIDSIYSLLTLTASVLIPLLLLIFIAALSSVLSQRPPKFLFQTDWINTQVGNPAIGFQRIFSFKNVSKAILGLPKVVILLIVGGIAFSHQADQLFHLSSHNSVAITSKLFDFVFRILLICSCAMVLVSLLDYLLERFSFHQNQRMTDQQLRDEQRMQDVDPSVAQKRRQLHQQYGHR